MKNINATNGTSRIATFRIADCSTVRLGDAALVMKYPFVVSMRRIGASIAPRSSIDNVRKPVNRLTNLGVSAILEP